MLKKPLSETIFMTRTYNIQPASHELFLEALLTAPGIRTGWVNFTASGLTEPEFFAQVQLQSPESERYEKDCAEHGVIPYSQTRLHYSAGFFEPTGLPIFCDGSADKTAHLIRGGKIALIQVELRGLAHSPLEELNSFREKLVPALAEQFYQVEAGKLSLNLHLGTGPDNGELSMVRTPLRTGEQTGLTVKFTGTDYFKKNLERWALGLADKYHKE